MEQSYKAPAPHHIILSGECRQHDIPAALPEATGEIPGLLYICTQVSTQRRMVTQSEVYIAFVSHDPL